MTAPEHVAPPDTRLSSARRLLGVDAARGVALIGMMSVHINPAVTPAGETTTSYLIASGRSAALFAVLAGVGLALASGGPTPRRGRPLSAAMAATLARALVLGLVGLLLGAFESGLAIILVYYGLLFVVAVPFLGLGPRVLFPLAATAAVVAPAISQWIRPSLPASSYGNPVVESLADPIGLLTELTVTGYYPVLTWSAYILAGLALGRLILGEFRTAVWVMVGGAVLAAVAWAGSWLLLHPGGGLEAIEVAGAGDSPIAGRPLDVALTTSFYGTTPTTSWWWLSVVAPHSGTSFDLLHTIGTACFV
ncbi:MAG TPA: heparan-alpha-glucosaminide N-acetyltransferase domain-containing protein, partial [Jiangellaceae bacterium]